MWLRMSAVVWKGPILFQFKSLSDTCKITCVNIPCLWYFMRNLNKCFVFCFPLYIYLAKDAEHVNKNIKNKCWNVWYEAYLLTNDDTSPAASSGSSTPATPQHALWGKKTIQQFWTSFYCYNWIEYQWPEKVSQSLLLHLQKGVLLFFFASCKQQYLEGAVFQIFFH